MDWPRAEDLAWRQGNAQPQEPEQEPSACSCRLPLGWWGSGGWHLRRLSAAEAPSPSYIGVELAVEQCPLYQAVLERDHARKMADQNGSTVSQRGKLRA